MADTLKALWKDHPTLAGAAGIGGLALMLAWNNRKSIEAHLPASTDKYRPGDDYKSNTALAIDVVKELRKAGIKSSITDIRTLLDFAFTAAKGQPVDDRLMTMEKVIAVVTKLPQNSKARRKLTGILITGLWDSLDHPPLSFQGPQYQYRQADGSYNNVLMPKLGAAGTPYAKSIRTTQKLHATKPDPGVLFDSLMAREPSTYKENPAGASSMLFYHAAIITHDIFRSNRFDPNISDTSSYLDLAPLYGSSVGDQAKIRTFKGGMLKPDTYFEERLLAQPPGINVMLVLYSRYHNYVADMLFKINEGGRFNLKPGPEDEARKAQDEQLFQTARLIVNGLYINICLHDYLRGLTNTHHSDSTWTLDPRVEIPGGALKAETARGIGNQVSTEFNLMYRFHSTVSKRDEKWFEDFFREITALDKPLAEASPREMLLALQKFEKSTPEDPSQRTFAGLKRDKNGKFADADLVKILKESIEDTAGLFGPRNVPKALRVIEILGIQRSREWHTASLNEFRRFFGLKEHTSFEDINPDPEIADTLRGFYGHPDMVEAYPGMWLEDAKPAMNPGCGGCPPYTVGRAIFSDAVTLVRSDRFYTLDYTAATLTNWGMTEVEQDYETLGGSMLYKLIQRGLPGWFPFNSLHVMQPFFTKETNRKIAEEIGVIKDYTLADPKPPPAPKLVFKAKTARTILKDPENFGVPWLKGFLDMADGHDYSHFMLSGDGANNVAQRKLVGGLLNRLPEFKKLVFDTTFQVADRHFKSEMFYWGKNVQGVKKFEIDLVRDVAIPTLTHVLADLFVLDLKTEENPNGTYTVASLYSDLLAVRTWGFNNLDAAQAWRRRREAREAAARLLSSTKKNLYRLIPRSEKLGLIPRLINYFFGSGHHNHGHGQVGTLRWYGIQVAAGLIHAGESYDRVADILYLTAVAGVGVPISQFTEGFYWIVQNQTAYEKVLDIKNLAMANNDEADERLEKYVLEGQRMSSGQRDLRVVKSQVTVDGVTYNPGDIVILILGSTLIPTGATVGVSMDEELYPNATTFSLDRPKEDYMSFGWGMHQCLGKEISTTFSTAMMKASTGMQLMNWAPGEPGALRPITVSNNRLYLSEDGAYLTTDPTTLKCHFSSYTHDQSQMPKIPTLPTPPPPLEEKKDEQLRPCDLADEMWHIHETGHEYTKEEFETSFEVNAPPGTVINVGGEGGQRTGMFGEAVKWISTQGGQTSASSSGKSSDHSWVVANGSSSSTSQTTRSYHAETRSESHHHHHHGSGSGLTFSSSSS